MLMVQLLLSMLMYAVVTPCSLSHDGDIGIDEPISRFQHLKGQYFSWNKSNSFTCKISLSLKKTLTISETLVSTVGCMCKFTYTLTCIYLTTDILKYVLQ